MDYNTSNPIDIERYAKILENKTFYEIMPHDVTNNKAHKGGLGTIVEKYHFGYEPNSNSEADFAEAGVELKVTPYKQNMNKTYSSKERLVLNIINYMNEYKYDFENSSFWKKNKLILLIFYLFQQGVSKENYKITHAQLFEFPEKDLEIIKSDWNTIVSKIKEGRAHELSESDTFYLSACTKGANKESLRKQPFSNELAKQRAFSLKSSYMTYVLNEYILKRKQTYIPITDDLQGKTIDEFILGIYRNYFGRSLSDLCNLFDINEASKGKTYLIAAKMLNSEIKDLNKSEEFIKSNTKIKAIRIEENGKIKESMSFPTFKYNEIINETWEESELRNMFLDTRFLFVVFKKNKEDYIFDNAFFWTIPAEDLDQVEIVWNKTIIQINNGLAHDLPKQSENPVAHVRPHARNASATYPTPYGENLVKKCFWLNNSYILEQIKKEENVSK
ncbi:Sau3AI family type II restriction endonuclease [Bacillus sp. UNCCL81]|uniref:Sau3AI family type II restriction endonuclease n=1 Tax=Bacillus sp. UNCCL81 TaxID=1502755 RepID=UPI0008E8A5F2|nr:Sau3AI family type II restriction endonuclease [Bacillus sp. UNCCL81]SFC95110.1 DNA mismatch repair protein MutH [Bacillus sp. UNCCL81]